MAMSADEQKKAVKFYLKQEDPPSVREFQRLLDEDGLDEAPTTKRNPAHPNRLWSSWRAPSIVP